MDEARAPAEKANPSTGTSTTTSNAAPPTTTTITTTTTSSSTTLTPTPTPGSISIAGASEAQGQGAPPPLRHGHELPFVAPSSYLRPKPAGRDMTTEKKAEKKKAPPLTVLDKEQLQGLVSTIPRHTSTSPSCPVPVSPLAPRPPPPRAPRPRAASCGVPARLPAPYPGPARRQRHRPLTYRPPPQRGIREFLKVRTSYDVLPLSFRLVVLDNDLLIRKSLNILIQNSTVSHPPPPRPGPGLLEVVQS